jgi:neuronal calcium sensor 1
LTIYENELTIKFYSQSKLSQQELADLQKATHFDKKELQQWYKGKC